MLNLVEENTRAGAGKDGVLWEGNTRFRGSGGAPCEPLENDESHPVQVPTGSNFRGVMDDPGPAAGSGTTAVLPPSL